MHQRQPCYFGILVFALSLLLVTPAHLVGQHHKNTEVEDIPVATDWLLDAAGETQRTAIKSVLMLRCPVTKKKGTAFVLKRGVVVTNEHVVRGCTPQDLMGITALGANIKFIKMTTDAERDLALLRSSTQFRDGLELASGENPKVGTAVSTWGYPLGYNGPAPLLSVGFLSGYRQSGGGGRTVKHFVVNGAFNPGNSGGPLFQAQDDKVIGIVVSKHAPLTPLVKSAIEAPAKQRSGVVYTTTDEQGNTKELSEAQVVVEVLKYFRSLMQVMIGEAIAVSELRSFLKEKEEELQ